VTTRAQLPLPVKLLFTLFVCVLVPVYWIHIGPSNLLWTCDIALIATVVALWTEHRLLTGAIALAVLLPDLVWNVDFFSRLLLGADDLLGFDATSYMFESATPIWLRALSLFHVFSPLLLWWMVRRLGYDRRALFVTTVAWWLLFPLTRWLTAPEKNINWAFGIGSPPWTPLPDGWYLLTGMLAFPLGVFLPTHLVLMLVSARRRRA
jgi:hypothetical protein